MFDRLTRRAAVALVLAGVALGAPAMALAGPKLVIDVTGQAKGTIVIDLNDKVAPAHVAQLIKLAESGAYDGVVFHRVISGFMAQTGDVKFGKSGSDISLAGRGGSDLPDLKAEFSALPFKAGTVGMARGSDPDSANSQFFIMFDDGPNLNGQYTVVGQVESGMAVVRSIKKGRSAQNGLVNDPDHMVKVRVKR